MYEYIAEDKWNKKEFIEIGGLAVAFFVLIFYFFNTPEIAGKLTSYLILLIGGLVFILIAYTVPKFKEWSFDTILWEKSKIIPERFDKLLLLGMLGIGLVTFFIIGRTGYAITGETFQIIELDTMQRAIISFFTTYAEDLCFYSVSIGLIFLVSYGLTKNFPFAMFMILLANPIVWVIYHTYHYGFEDLVSSVVVYVFGLENTAIVLLLGKLFYAHMRHGFNNASITIFKQMSFATFITLMLTSIWFWIILIIVVAILVYKLRKRR